MHGLDTTIGLLRGCASRQRALELAFEYLCASWKSVTLYQVTSGGLATMHCTGHPHSMLALTLDIAVAEQRRYLFQCSQSRGARPTRRALMSLREEVGDALARVGRVEAQASASAASPQTRTEVFERHSAPSEALPIAVPGAPKATRETEAEAARVDEQTQVFTRDPAPTGPPGAAVQAPQAVPVAVPQANALPRPQAVPYRRVPPVPPVPPISPGAAGRPGAERVSPAAGGNASPAPVARGSIPGAPPAPQKAVAQGSAPARRRAHPPSKPPPPLPPGARRQRRQATAPEHQQ